MFLLLFEAFRGCHCKLNKATGNSLPDGLFIVPLRPVSQASLASGAKDWRRKKWDAPRQVRVQNVQTGSIQSILLLSALIYMIRIDANCFGASSIPSESIVTYCGMANSSTYCLCWAVGCHIISHFLSQVWDINNERSRAEAASATCHVSSLVTLMSVNVTTCHWIAGY